MIKVLKQDIKIKIVRIRKNKQSVDKKPTNIQ